MSQRPPGEPRSTREAQTDLDSALGSSVHTAIESWVDGDLGGSRDLAGPALTFEHPKWGAFVLVVEPTTLMCIEATARHRKRIATQPPRPRVSIPSADELAAIVRRRMAEPFDEGATPAQRHVACFEHLRSVLETRLGGSP